MYNKNDSHMKGWSPKDYSRLFGRQILPLDRVSTSNFENEASMNLTGLSISMALPTRTEPVDILQLSFEAMPSNTLQSPFSLSLWGFLSRLRVMNGFFTYKTAVGSIQLVLLATHSRWEAEAGLILWLKARPGTNFFSIAD